MKMILKLEKSYLIIILVLPIASVFLSLGNNLDIGWLKTIGDSIFDNLPVLFALSIAHGFSKDQNGYAVISALIGYLAFDYVIDNLYGNVKMGIFGGIVVGFTSALIYNKLVNHSFAGFFEMLSKRRVIPIVSFLVHPFLGIAFGALWIELYKIIEKIAISISSMGNFGLFLFGFLNRLLLPFGLHYNLNNYMFYELGEYNGVYGDLNRFLAGDPLAGNYMAGFYIIFMFGLPAMMLSFYFKVSKENRKHLIGLYVISTVTCIITGITEPIEILFVFLLPELYLLHAGFTGLAMAITPLFKVNIGFNFSAGLLDFISYVGQNPNNLKILPLGVCFGILYFTSAHLIIKYFHLPVPGNQFSNDKFQRESAYRFANDLIDTLGGKENILYIELKYTRFEITVKNPLYIDDSLILRLDNIQFIKIDEYCYQLVTGNRGHYLSKAFEKVLPDKMI